MSKEGIPRKNSFVRLIEDSKSVEVVAGVSFAINFIKARQMEMGLKPEELAGRDEPFIALAVFSVVVAGIYRVIRKAEKLKT